MKLITFAVVVLALSMSNCTSQQKLVDNPPFTLGEASCQAWKGGRAETGSGMLLEINITDQNKTDLKMQEAFFRGKKAPISMSSKEGVWLATANFVNASETKKDMVMHADGTQEVGNQPPILKEKIPFELEPTECVVSYVDGDTVKYFKVTGIKEKKTQYYK